MTTDVTVPAAGESVTSANVARWHFSHGDTVQKGDVLVTLETDKVSNELEADADGILEILVNEGEEVAIGTLIAHITASEPGAQPAAAPMPAGTSAATAPQPPALPQAEPSQSTAATAPIALAVPPAGESITSATVAKWLKNDGDQVTMGETLVILETDKVSNELEAPANGILHIITPEGDEVEIGTTIASIDPGGRELQPTTAPEPAHPAPKAAGDMPQPRPAPQPVPAAPAPARPTPTPAPRPASVPAHRSPAPAPAAAPVSDGRTTRRKMSMLRRKIATHLVNAQHTAAILTTFNEVDMTEIMSLRKTVQEEFIKKHGVKLGFMSFFVKAVTQALKDVPSINGSIEGNEVVQNHFYDIGVAIGTEKGLVVPVLRDCDKKSFAEIEQDIIDYATKARDGKITIDDLRGGVFSISNGGTYGSLLSTPILNPPQSGILGMHTIQQRPVALNGEVVIRPMMYLALSYDHRLVDGKEAVTFLIKIKESLESPARLMLDM